MEGVRSVLKASGEGEEPAPQRQVLPDACQGKYVIHIFSMWASYFCIIGVQGFETLPEG